MVRPGPVERVRRGLAERLGPEWAARLPSGYQRLGGVVLVRWPESLRPEFAPLAERLRGELRAESVLRVEGPAQGEWRIPRVELLAGEGTETEVREDGLRFRLDAARILYSAGNRTERARMARLPAPGETVIDLFAGIGYFALPIGRHSPAARVVAVEENPESFAYLAENVRLNRLEAVVDPIRGDNRSLPLAEGSADRVLLGILPDSLPWIPRAIELMRPEGGWVHAHRLTGSSEPPGAATAAARDAVNRAGRTVRRSDERRVKSYGPGRQHVVLDLEIGPRG